MSKAVLFMRECSGLGLPPLNREVSHEPTPSGSYQSCGKMYRLCMKIKEVAFEGCKMGHSDPQKVIFAAKMGLALAVVSLLNFVKEPLEAMSENSIWAIMTVVVVFEFSVGATFNKGFNRALGTLSAGVLSVGIGQMSVLAGNFQGAIIITSIFIADLPVFQGFCASFVKLYPTMKDYECSFRVFLLTYCTVLVNPNADFIETAVTRLVLIAVGATVCLVVNTCIFPIWAGKDLHRSLVENFRRVADSLEGCVEGYLQYTKNKRMPSKIKNYQNSGYQFVVQSAIREDNLMGYATWELPHDSYRRCSYPWKLFIKVSGALRHCTFMVLTMQSCMLSTTQAPAALRLLFGKELKKVGNDAAKVLRELGNKVEKMEKLSRENILLHLHKAAEDLQLLIDQKSYLLVKSESWQYNSQQKELKCTGRSPNFKDKIEHTTTVNETLNGLALGRRSVPSFTDLDPHNQIMISTQVVLRRHMSWPSHLSLRGYTMLNKKGSRTYESLSTLSLGTFASLLIEFISRLQNLVDSFEQLSKEANFKDPDLTEILPNGSP